MSDGRRIADDSAQRNQRVFTADSAGVFNIKTATRLALFGPVVCFICRRLMKSAALDTDGRAWTLLCEEGHTQRQIGHTAM